VQILLNCTIIIPFSKRKYEKNEDKFLKKGFSLPVKVIAIFGKYVYDRVIVILLPVCEFNRNRVETPFK